MKKYFSAFCVLALAAGCAKENIAPEQTSTDEVLLTSYAGQPLTKTTISGDKVNGFTANWEETDAIGVYTTAGPANAKHSITVLPDGTAKFTGKVTASENEQTLYAYSPYSETATGDYKAVALTLPAEQYMEAATYDEAAAVMVGKPQTATLEGGSAEIGNWQFAHLGSFIQVSTKDITAEGISADETVTQVTLKATGKKLAGDFKLNLEDGQMTFTKASAEVTVDVPLGTTLGNLAAWVVTAPFSLANEELLVKIVTNKHTIAKSIALTKEFKAGNVYTLGVNVESYLTIEDSGNLTFNIHGETKTFKVYSNVDWSVESDNEAFTATKVDENTLTVKKGKNIYFTPQTGKVTLSGNGVSKMLDFTQKTLWKAHRGNCVFNEDGSVTITAVEGTTDNEHSPRIMVDINSLANAVDFGNFTFKIRETNLSKGFLHINTLGHGNSTIYYQIQIGGTNKLTCSGAWNWGAPHLKENGADKDFNIEDINKITRLSFKVSPWSNGGWNNATRFQLWVNNDNDQQVDGTTLNFWGTGNPWAPNAANWNWGVDFYVGISDAVGSITIESCDFTQISRQ